jgi:multiple sugar transport system permease protein
MKERTRGYLFILPSYIVIAIVVIFPYCFVVWLSFHQYDILKPGNWAFVGLSNFITEFRNPLFHKSLINTLYFVFGIFSSQFVFGFAVALVLNQKFKGRAFFRTIILIPWVMSIVVASVIFRSMYQPDFGILNGILMKIGIIKNEIHWLGEPRLAMISIIAAYTWRLFPFTAIMLLAGLQAVPSELYDAAIVDGAGAVQKFVYITIPQIKSVISVVSTLQLVGCFSAFTIVYILTGGGPLNSTQILSIYLRQRSFDDFEFGAGAAVSVILSIIIVVLIIIYVMLSQKKEKGI